MNDDPQHSPPEGDLPGLAPPQGVDPQLLAAAEARHALFRALGRSASKQPRFQFSLGELAAFTACCAPIMALAHYLPLRSFAAFTGMIAVLAMYLGEWIPPRARWLKWAWMVLAATYLIAAFVAAARG